jgi:hypothetical protein
MFLAFCGSSSAEESLFGKGHLIYRAAEMACELKYGENHLADSEQSTLKHYCQRLQNPVEFLQDQDWWKQHAPALLQASRHSTTPKESLLDLPSLQEANAVRAFSRCLSNGGSQQACRRGVGWK